MDQQAQSLGLRSLSSIPSSDGHAASTSGWYNLTAWAVNVTRYAPFVEELVKAGPRLITKLGSYISLVESVDASTQHFEFASDSTPNDLLGLTIPNLNPLPNYAMPPAGSASDDPLSQVSRLSLDGTRGLGSVFSYATSKWAISCIGMAIILNRTHIFAATRRRLRLRWHARLIIRSAPIVLFGVEICRLLQAIQCQTSEKFSSLRWGDNNKSSEVMFAHPNNLLNSLSSALLLGATDKQSCVAASMIPEPELGDRQELRGSLSRLWPLFGTLCLSHFLETVSCAVQGRLVAAETGMTLFEQSLAFAEADAAVSNKLGWGTFSKSQQESQDSILTSPAPGSAIALTRALILKRVNTAPEVLMVATLSAMTHMTSHVLGIFDLQAKYRLLNTGLWGLCFMASILWSSLSFELGNPLAQGLLRFPTVCIIGFIPHVLVLLGIITCVCIYGLALLLSALAPPMDQQSPLTSLRQRLSDAHNNMQANVSLSDIRITREMDFYTALLRTGFAAITMASEAVYLNEDRGVSLQQHTWLEEARLREVEELQRQCIGMGLPKSQHDRIGTIGLIPIKGSSMSAPSGYSRERAAQKLPSGCNERGLRVGTGATERSSRWLMALEFLWSTSKLVGRVGALGLLSVMGALRVPVRPSWLLRLARRPKPTVDGTTAAEREQDYGAPQRLSSLQDDDNSPLAGAGGIDVEAEFRRVGQFEDEDSLDNDLYRYWLKGGWWSSNDSSGDFEPTSTEDDWDTTSVITTSSTGGDTELNNSDWELEGEGQKTPTQRILQRSRHGTPSIDIPLEREDLARLLHPTSREEQEEALTLAAHLRSETVMTRADFQQSEHFRRTRILTTGACVSPNKGPVARNARLRLDEEERILEQMLLARRQASSREANGPAYHDGTDCPLCVVCQSSSRTIIVWPCRCLSLCDDCRVSLAMNNFDKCVCCRRDVMSFSRIYVP